VVFKGGFAAVAFDENVISAQELARAMSVTPHLMGKDMQYGGILVLSVTGVNDLDDRFVNSPPVSGQAYRRVT
jgi:hypothetical protein